VKVKGEKFVSYPWSFHGNDYSQKKKSSQEKGRELLTLAPTYDFQTKIITLEKPWQ
jgi:hypothetical protein